MPCSPLRVLTTGNQDLGYQHLSSKQLSIEIVSKFHNKNQISDKINSLTNETRLVTTVTQQ